MSKYIRPAHVQRLAASRNYALRRTLAAWIEGFVHSGMYKHVLTLSSCCNRRISSHRRPTQKRTICPLRHHLHSFLGPALRSAADLCSIRCTPRFRADKRKSVECNQSAQCIPARLYFWRSGTESSRPVW